VVGNMRLSTSSLWLERLVKKVGFYPGVKRRRQFVVGNTRLSTSSLWLERLVKKVGFYPGVKRSYGRK